MGKKKESIVKDSSADTKIVETEKVETVEAVAIKPAKKNSEQIVHIFMKKQMFLGKLILKCHLKYKLAESLVAQLPADSYIKLRTK